MNEYKALNLYAGIGGNRMKWPKNCKVTAVEYDPKIAAIYQDLYPEDTVIVGDAHSILLEIAGDFNYVWASPPCPSHSVTNHFLQAQGVKRYPDMGLYQEIIYLDFLAKHKPGFRYTVENVKPYYKPLIPAQESGRHLFWANFKIPMFKAKSTIGRFDKVKSNGGKRTSSQGINNLNEYHRSIGLDLSKYSYHCICHIMSNKRWSIIINKSCC